MTTREENRLVVLKTMAMGTSDARRQAQQDCRRILSAREDSIEFQIAVRTLLSSICASEPPPMQVSAETVQRLTAKLIESRGLPLNPALACELGEFLDRASGPVSPAERSLLTLWIDRHEMFSAGRWRKLMERHARMNDAPQRRQG